MAGVLIAGGVHAVKASARPVVNVSTAGAGAPVVSTLEDIGAVIVTVLALLVPVLAAIVIITIVVLAIVTDRTLAAAHRAAHGQSVGDRARRAQPRGWQRHAGSVAAPTAAGTIWNGSGRVLRRSRRD